MKVNVSILDLQEASLLYKHTQAQLGRLAVHLHQGRKGGRRRTACEAGAPVLHSPAIQSNRTLCLGQAQLWERLAARFWDKNKEKFLNGQLQGDSELKKGLCFKDSSPLTRLIGGDHFIICATSNHYVVRLKLI